MEAFNAPEPSPKRRKLSDLDAEEPEKEAEIRVEWIQDPPVALPPSLTPLPPNRFYSSRSETESRRIQQYFDYGEAMKRSLSLKHVFKKQDAAFAFADAQPQVADVYDKPRVFSCETEGSTTGSRKFIVASWREFWKVYKRLPATRRFFYEVIRENEPCCLYFDIEYARDMNPSINDEALMRTFLDALREALRAEFQVELLAEHIVDLDASSASKFSRHLIVKSCVFRNNAHVGLFVRRLMIKLYTDSLSGSSPYSTLFLPNDKGQRVSVVDMSVYSRNRNFRLFLSTKMCKNRPLLKSSACEYPGDEKSLFFASLVCNIPADNARLLESTEESDVPGDIARLSTVGSKTGAARRGQSFADSLFPELDAWVAREVRRRPGAQEAYLRSWTFFPSYNLVVYNLGANRFCENINREHKSNHVSIAVDLKSCTMQQRCLDPDCKALGFRGRIREIPAHVVCPLIGDMEFSIESGENASDETLLKRLETSQLLSDAELLELDLDSLVPKGQTGGADESSGPLVTLVPGGG